MLGDLADIAIDQIPVGNSKAQQPLEKDVEFRSTAKDDIGEIQPLFLQLKHDIHKRSKLATMLGGDVDDVVADIRDAFENIVGGVPSVIGVFGEHPASDQFDRVVVDLFLILEVLVDSRPGDSTLGGDKRQIGITIAFTGEDFERSLQDFFFSFLVVYFFWHAGSSTTYCLGPGSQSH